MKIKTNKQKTNKAPSTHIHTKSQTKQNATKAHKNTRVVCPLTTPEHGPTLECGWYSQWHSPGENWVCPLQTAFWLGEELWSIYPQVLGHVMAWTCAGLVHDATSFEFMHAPVLSIWKIPFPSHPLALDFTTVILFHIEPWSSGTEFDGDIPFRTQCSKASLSFSAHCLVVALCPNSHLLHKVSLMGQTEGHWSPIIPSFLSKLGTCLFIKTVAMW